MMSFALPDLRFEQTFMKQLNGYAKSATPAKKEPASLTESEIARLYTELDEPVVAPLPQITIGVVAYAVFKDQIIMPLLQGFLWSGFLIAAAPALSWVVYKGQGTGIWVANLIGLNKLGRMRNGRY